MSTTLPTADREGELLKVQFPYNARHIHQVRLLGHASWDPAAKAWQVPYSEAMLGSLQRIFPGLQLGSGLQAQGARSPIELEELKHAGRHQDTAVRDFEFRTEPFRHQRISFNFARSLPQSALLLEQGLGKAKIVIDLAAWRHQQGQARRVLVVCPNSVTAQWVEELHKHGHPNFSNSVVLSGSTKKRAATLQQLAADSGWQGWIITSYDSLRGLFPTLYKLQAYPSKLFEMMVLDESSKIKHASSQRSKLSWKLGCTVTYRNILTGTPITQGAEDIFGQYRFLKPDIFGIYATAFRGSYLIMGGFEERQVVGYKNTSDLLKRIYSVAIRFTKEQCLDLPPKLYTTRTAELSGELSRKYRQLESQCVAEFDGAIVATPLMMARLMKLSQLTGGFIYEQLEGGARRVHDLRGAAKLGVLEELLEEARGQKVIIWCRFLEELRLIRELLIRLKLRYVELSGKVKAEHRGGVVRAFQEDPSYPVLLGQVATGGMGVTLTAARLVIYYSNTYALEDRLQSEDRCHRIGQDHPVTYVDITAVTEDGRPTIDQDVLEVLKSKEAFAREVSLQLISLMAARHG